MLTDWTLNYEVTRCNDSAAHPLKTTYRSYSWCDEAVAEAEVGGRIIANHLFHIFVELSGIVNPTNRNRFEKRQPQQWDTAGPVQVHQLEQVDSALHWVMSQSQNWYWIKMSSYITTLNSQEHNASRSSMGHQPKRGETSWTPAWKLKVTSFFPPSHESYRFVRLRKM